MPKSPRFEIRPWTTPSDLVIAIEDGRISRKRAYRVAPVRLAHAAQAVRRATHRYGAARAHAAFIACDAQATRDLQHELEIHKQGHTLAVIDLRERTQGADKRLLDALETWAPSAPAAELTTSGQLQVLRELAEELTTRVVKAYDAAYSTGLPADLVVAEGLEHAARTLCEEICDLRYPWEIAHSVARAAWHATLDHPGDMLPGDDGWQGSPPADDAGTETVD